MKVLSLLKSPAIWRLFAGLLTIAGVNLSPEDAEAIATAGVSVSIAIEAIGHKTNPAPPPK